MMTSETSKGFTLIELLVVLAIIVLLASAGYFSLSGFNEGQALRLCREEAAALIENARSQAVYSGQKRKVVFNSGTGKFQVEDNSGNLKSDPVKLEKGVTISGPANFIFRATGELDGGSAVTYTFTAPRSARTSTLTVHPKSGRVEKV